MNEGAIENKTEANLYDVDSMSKLSKAEAKRMIAENDLLKEDPYTKEVAANDFVVQREGKFKELNAGAFICFRNAMLEQMRASVVLDEGRESAHLVELQAAMVVHNTVKEV